jgi:hypothetical protein
MNIASFQAEIAKKDVMAGAHLILISDDISNNSYAGYPNREHVCHV